jgi:diacylglycerol kinase
MNENSPKKKGLKRFLQSFGFAAGGLKQAFTGQANFRIHLAAVAVVVSAGLFLGLNGTEWCLLVLAMGLVIALELANTAIELLTDLVSPGYDERAGRVKDIAAAAVLVAAIAAVIIGALIFLPKILNFFPGV